MFLYYLKKNRIVISTFLLAFLSVPHTSFSETTSRAKFDSHEHVELKAKALRGDALSQYNLGIMYFTGRLVQRSCDTAEKWFLNAAKQGLPEAQYNLGILKEKGPYLNCKGINGSSNRKEAAEWYHKASVQEFRATANAQYNLGMLYRMGGLNFDSDLDKAMVWFLKAAERGHAAAQYKLANLYQSNNRKNMPEYRKWMTKSAKNGNPDACYSLGSSYFFGTKGWPKDRAKSRAS